MEYLKTHYRFSIYGNKKKRKSAKRLQNSATRRQFPNIEYDKQQEYRFGIYKKLPGIRGNGNRYGYQRRLSSSEELGVHISAISEYNRHIHQQYNAEDLQKVDKGDKPSQTNQVDKRPDNIDDKPDDTREHQNIDKKVVDNDSGHSGHLKEESNDDWRPKDKDPPSCQEKEHSPDGKFKVVEMDKNPRECYEENDTVSKFKWEGGKKKRPMIVCCEWDNVKRHDKKHFMRSKISGELEDTPRDWNEKERPFVPRIYGVLNQRLKNRKYNVEDKPRPHNHGSLDMSSDLHGYRYRGYANNNAFHPGRYFRANASLPNRRWPAGLGGATKEYLSNENVSMRPKVLTIVRHGTRPRNTVKIFLNRRSIQSFEQVMGDISEAFGPKWKNSRVRKLYTLKGREVQGISDFFRHDDVFVACSNESINEEDFRDIMQEMFPDSHYAKNRHREFDRSRRKRHQPVQKEADNDKRDSGFGEASEGSNSLRESDQEAMHTGQVQGHGHGRPEEKRRRERKDKDKRSLSPAKDSHREEVSESPREQPKDMFGKGLIDDRERARKRQQKMMESEKRALEDERRKRGLVPLKAQDDPFKKMKDREKEKLEARRKREQEKKRQQEEEEKERKRKEFEEAEKAARARKAAAEKEEREKEEREKAEREKEERIKAEKEKEQEKAKDKDKDHETNKEKDKDKNGEKEKVKEKDNKDSEKPHSKKRQKTKIVRRTKAERQIPNDEPVLSKYDLGRTLGDGNFAIVRTSKLKASGQEFAMKVIDKPKLKGKEHMVENEIEIMKDCSHHNIVKLYEEYETPDKLYLVMELVKGGDLFDAITQSVKFGEVDSANMVKDLCNALFYLHSRSIVHRDLKPENLLVHRNKDGSITLKLADFGLAMEVKELIYTVCGTPTYVAPEILSEIGYGLEVDMWAVGVISYILLCGFPPFRSPDRNQTELFEFIKAGAYEFLSPYWDYISNAAKDMIQHLLVVEKKRRYTAIEVLSHPWIIGGGDMSLLMDSARIDESRRERRKELELQAKQNLESYTRMKEKRKAKEE